MKKTILCVITLFVFALFLNCAAFAQKEEPLANAQTIANVKKLVEDSKIPFQQVGNDMWILSYKGKNKKDIKVMVSPSDYIIVYMLDLCDPKNLIVNEELYKKMIKLSNEYDMIKFVFSNSGVLYIRLDSYTKTIDLTQFIEQADQIATAADSAYPELKKFFKAEE